MDLRNRTGVSMMACKKALLETSGDEEAAIDLLRKQGVAKAAKKSDRETSEGIVVADGRGLLVLRCETDFVAKNEDFVAFANQLLQTLNDEGVDAMNALFEAEKADKIAQMGENLEMGTAIVLEGGDTSGVYVHSNGKAAAIVALDGGNEEVARDIAMHTVAMSPKVLSPSEVSDELLESEKGIWIEQLKNEGKPENIMEKIMMGKEKKFREEHALLTQSFVKNPEQTIDAYAKANGATVVGYVLGTV